MIQPGIINLLRANRTAPPGMYLIDEDGTEVLLPNKYVPEDLLLDDEIEVFVFYDSEDRMTATTATPKVQLNQFAGLQVLEVNAVGAFLDWGLEKDLLVPFAEQERKMQQGETYLIRMYYDETTRRLVGSSRIGKFLSNEQIDLKVGDEVDLIIGEKTDLGRKVIINNQYLGLLYKNEIFQTIRTGSTTKGYIKNIREDKKIDVSLQQQGYQNIEPNAQKILTALTASDGFLPMNDKSSPELIQHEFEMSKKTFKKAIGALYRERRIRIEPDGIHLVN